MFCCHCGTTLPDIIDFCSECGCYVPHSRNTRRPLPSTNETRARRVRELFEGREAIYREWGALHVKVSNIQMNIHLPGIFADITEIPTAGFPTGLLHPAPSPRCWRIGAGCLQIFSEDSWHMGYGGWSLLFAPRIVDGVLRLAQEFPANTSRFDRYVAINRYLMDHAKPTLSWKVFGES